MRRSVLALAGTVIVAALAVAVTSRNPGTSTPPRTEPARNTPVEPDATASYASTPRYESDWGYSGGARTNAAADGPRASEPRKAVGTAGRPPRTPRTSGTEVEFLADAAFRRLDANGDGVLTGAEIPTALRGAVNGRGAIDPETFAKVFQATVQQLRASNAAATLAWFQTLDTDRDGHVSLSEWRAAGRSAADFQRMDADGDGRLTPREVQAFAAQSGPPAGPGATRPASASGAPQSPKGTTSRTGTNAPSRADALFAHYTAVASGSAPNPMTTGAMSSRTVVATSAPAKPAATAAPASPAAAPPAAPAPAPASPPPVESATLPLPFTGAPYWEFRDTENVMELFAGERPSVLFLGDSITDYLQSGAGKPLWDEYYAPLGALDFAIGGIRTSHVLWQVETGQVLQAKPKVVVLLIGSNNLGIANQEPEEVAAGIEKIVDELGVQLPRTRVLLLGLLPRGADATDPFREKIAKVNGLIADLHDGGRVTYLDIGAGFVSPDGSISPDVMPDGAHPSLWGYVLYSLALWPTLTDLLKP